jgi:hypothetical protein
LEIWQVHGGQELDIHDSWLFSYDEPDVDHSPLKLEQL